MPSSEDEPHSRAHERVGTVLRGKYRLDRVLGEGGMAVVYKATHRNDADFAVKMLHPELSRNQGLVTRFLREGKAANSVRHPGVVRVVDDDVSEDGTAFLVMDLLEGSAIDTLWERAERARERLPLPAVLSMAHQLLDVLVAAHDKGVVHRDIKPANLFVTRDGTLKVLDFGIARVRDAAAETGRGTASGVLLGTPAFMAPEQAFGKSREIDGQTDLWAVGSTMFALLTGELVHKGDNAAQLMVLAATERARPVGDLVSLPAAVARVVDRALEFDKEARWPNAAAMRDAIEAACVEATGTPPAKAALAALVAEHDLGGAKTEPPPPMSSAETMGLPEAAAPAAPTLGPARSHEPAPPSVPILVGSTMLQAGSTTGPRMMPDPTSTASSAVRTRPRAPVMAAAVAGVLVVGVVLRMASGRGTAGATPPPASPPASAPAPLPVAASVASAEIPLIDAPPPLPVAAAPPMTARAPSPRVAAPGASPIVTAPRAPSAAPKPSASPSCNPPTYVDEQRHVHIKPGCE